MWEQRKIVRIIGNKGYIEDVRNVFKLEGLLTFPCLNILHTLVLACKSLQNYTEHNQIHNYNTRNQHDIKIDHLNK